MPLRTIFGKRRTDGPTPLRPLRVLDFLKVGVDNILPSGISGMSDINELYACPCPQFAAIESEPIVAMRKKDFQKVFGEKEGFITPGNVDLGQGNA
jgi:hypothetical protein